MSNIYLIDCNLENILQQTNSDLSHNIDEAIEDVETKNEVEIEPHTGMCIYIIYD